MHSFLVVTTRNLPEAYVLVDFLLKRRQRVAVLNIKGRSLAASLWTAARIRRRRGTGHLVDMVLARGFRSLYQSPGSLPFPEVGPAAVDAMRREVVYQDSADPHDGASLGFVRAFGPDYILLAGAPVLRSALFAHSRRATLNRHLGMSPDYKGSDCALWAMRNDEFQRIGFTIHLVTEKVDGGGIVLQRPVTPRPGMSFSAFLAHLSETASRGFVEVLDGILAGAPLGGAPQVARGTYYPPAGLTTLRKAWRNYQRFTAPGEAGRAPGASPRRHRY
jgi:folate-dependent phosphoribosylglycinamide formyltransferase PurN